MLLVLSRNSITIIAHFKIGFVEESKNELTFSKQCKKNYSILLIVFLKIAEHWNRVSGLF
jgi:hypothetical protein